MKLQLSLIVATLTLACVLCFAPDAYLPMMLRAFMFWWAIALGSAALFAVTRRMWWWAVSCFLAAPMVFVQVNGTSSGLPVVGKGAALRIAHMNVLQPNDERSAVIAEVRSIGADLISAQEVSLEWADALEVGLAAAYPYRHVVPRNDHYGIALFSKWPFAQVGTIMIEGSPIIEAVLDVYGERVRVFAVHTTSPGTYAQYRQRNVQLKRLAELVRRQALPVVIIGDLNTVPWDSAFRSFCSISGTRVLDPPFMATWPVLGPGALIPLDHVLVSDGSLSGTSTTFHVSGSDHRGLVAHLRIHHAS